MTARIALVQNNGTTSLAKSRAEQHLLRTLTGVSLSAAEARAVWPWIIEHKWFLSEQLGRDVGLRVAAIDYLDNIQRSQALRAA